MKAFLIASAMCCATAVTAALVTPAPILAETSKGQNAASEIEHGRQVYEYWCATCHGPTREYPGTGALYAKYQGEIPAELDKRTDLSPEVVKYFVRNGISIMPFFRKTEISDPDLDALAAYLARER